MNFAVLEIDGEEDHIHLLIETYSISKLVNHLKGVSSRLIRKEFNLPLFCHFRKSRSLYPLWRQTYTDLTGFSSFC